MLTKPMIALVCIQENLWRPIVKEPVMHEDGAVTVHYEVPAGNNECLELSKRITPVVCPAAWNGCVTLHPFDSNKPYHRSPWQSIRKLFDVMTCT